MKTPYRGSRTPRTSLSPLSSSQHGSFNLTKTKQQTDPVDLIIESTDDLRQFSVFIFKKQCNLDQEKKRETAVDSIFKKSLREFHMELIGYEAVLTVRVSQDYYFEGFPGSYFTFQDSYSNF